MTSTNILISALRILATDIQSDDGVANAAIAEAADKLEEFDMSNRNIRRLCEQWSCGQRGMRAALVRQVWNISINMDSKQEAEE